MKQLLTFLLFIGLVSKHSAQENPLHIFEPLMGKTWEAQGQWGDGGSFIQRMHMHYGLDSMLVIVETEGYIDSARTVIGPRSHGIRQYNPNLGQIDFWEFDCHGGSTAGQVRSEGRDIYYRYSYGDMFLTDAWIYESDSSYQFLVGIYSKGAWEHTFLETRFEAQD